MIFQTSTFCYKTYVVEKETLQLSNATNFSSIRQETTKLQEFKVERFANKFVTVTTGKDPVRRRTSGLIFHPDNGSFAYIHWHAAYACHRPSYHWRMHGGAKTRRFSSLRLAVLTSTGPRFWFVWTEHERTHALMITTGMIS